MNSSPLVVRDLTTAYDLCEVPLDEQAERPHRGWVHPWRPYLYLEKTALPIQNPGFLLARVWLRSEAILLRESLLHYPKFDSQLATLRGHHVPICEGATSGNG